MWSDLTVSSDERRALIEGMRFVLGGDASDAREQAMLEVASEMLGGPLEQPEGHSPEVIARALTTPALRERALQSAMLATLMDERVTEAESAKVRALAAALGIEEPRERALHLLAQRRTALAWLDLARRSFARDAFEQALRDGGPGKLYRIVGPLLGLADDAELSQRFIGLGALDAGTLGRAYFEFITDNELSFPGEHRAVPEAGLWHDLTHVLGGYGITDAEEVLVVSFIAGYRKEDAFFWLFTIILQYHMGLKVSPYSPARRGLFDVRAAAKAYERGTHVACDLERWDPWPHFHRPLADVRRELFVPPRSDLA